VLSLRTAALSVPGSWPNATDVDFARYLTMAIKEANELESHLQRAVDSNLCPQAEHDALSAATVEVRKMLIGLRKRLLQ
jgi:four helix bundle protein